MPCDEGRTGAAPVLIAAAVPALCGMTLLEIAAWTGVLLVGAALDAREAAGWTGLGWIAAILVPGTPPASVAGAGALGAGLPALLACAALGGALWAWAAPAILAQPGLLLLAAGLIAAALQARERA